MDELKIIAVDQSNIDQEHICCAITDKKGETCVSSKKAWMQERFSGRAGVQKAKCPRKSIYRVYSCRTRMDSHTGRTVYAHQLSLGLRKV